MAGVEDIPGVVMVDGLPWTWETFPEFLDALDAGKRDIDVAALPAALPAAGVRDGPARRRPRTRHRRGPGPDAQAGRRGDRGRRAGLRIVAADDAQDAKAASPYRVSTPAQDEIEAIARGVDDAGGGLIQFVPDLLAGDYEPALQTVFDVAADVGLPVTFTLAIGNAGDPFFVWTACGWSRRPTTNGGEVTRADVPAAHRPGHRARAVRQPVRARIRATGSSPTCRWPSGSPRCANPKCANAF